MKMLRLVLLIATLPLGLVAGLVAFAARSDFVMRSCPEIPRDGWPATANCSDGWFAQWFFGSVSVASLCVFGLLVVRRLRA